MVMASLWSNTSYNLVEFLKLTELQSQKYFLCTYRFFKSKLWICKFLLENNVSNIFTRDWDTDVELNSSETADTSIISEEPRHRPRLARWDLYWCWCITRQREGGWSRHEEVGPANIYSKTHLMVDDNLMRWPSTVRRDETHSRENPMMATRQQYLKLSSEILYIMISTVVLSEYLSSNWGKYDIGPVDKKKGDKNWQWTFHF